LGKKRNRPPSAEYSPAFAKGGRGGINLASCLLEGESGTKKPTVKEERAPFGRRKGDIFGGPQKRHAEGEEEEREIPIRLSLIKEEKRKQGTTTPNSALLPFLTERVGQGRGGEKEPASRLIPSNDTQSTMAREG